MARHYIFFPLLIKNIFYFFFPIPKYGLYSGFAGTFVYIFFGTVKQVNIGPTAVVSLLTYSYTKNMNSDFAVLLCFLAGVVEFVSGLLHLGKQIPYKKKIYSGDYFFMVH